MVVELRILGSLRLTTLDGRELDPLLRQSKRVALLAYLAAAMPHGFHRRDTLLALFWPELDAPRARSALNQALYVLRKALGDQAIQTRGDGEVGVMSDVFWCDAAAFEQALDGGRAADALALYRGDLLDGFFIQDAPEFEHWVDSERQRLRQRASEGAWTLAEAKAREGSAVDAARWARRAADLLPADEGVVRRLMTLLHQLGDRAAAIRAYEAFIWRLSADYELEPSAETRALAEAIRREAAHPVSVQLEKLLPAPFPLVLHRIERKIPLRSIVAASITLAVFAAGAWTGIRRSDRPPLPVVRFALQSVGAKVVTTGVPGSTIAISPENDRVAFLAESAQGPQLFLRSMDQLNTVAVPHTRGAYLPFFSPDGKWLAFVGDGRIRKIPVEGGPAITICNVGTSVFGASWGSNDVIVFATSDALWQVNANGGSALLLAEADTAQGVRYRWPEVLPRGKAAIFTRVERAGFRLASITLATGVIRSLNVEGTYPHFVASGHLVFGRQDGSLLAVPFDESALTVEGPVIPVVDGITVGLLGAAKVGVSRAGALAYVPEHVTGRAVTLVDRSGRVDTLPLPLQGYSTARFALDARRIVADVIEPSLSSRDVWLFDLNRHTARRITRDSTSGYPQWSPDGSRIAFGTTSGGRDPGFSLRSIMLDRDQPTEILVHAEHAQILHAFAPDSRSVVFTRETAETQRDIWILPLTGERKPRAYLRTLFDERAAAVSPDGRWVAYVSNELGRDEVYVRGFPNPGEAMRVSDGGGREPRWARSGSELFYRSDVGMMAVAITTEPGLKVGRRQHLFDASAFLTIANGTGYDVHPDGERFLMIRRGAEAREIVVVLNVFDHVRTARR
jgi:DNA-binding SARP family transcriptional activator/Tol biopolymer transport system component